MEIEAARADYVLILAGDHLFNMDYRAFVGYHVETRADITMAVRPVTTAMAPTLGILKRNDDGRIESFTEKPQPEALAGLDCMSGPDKPYLASMGIYVFRTDLLAAVLKSSGDDVGKNIIPSALDKCRVMGHDYDGYWADIGTIRAFYDVNLEMALTDRPYLPKGADHFISDIHGEFDAFCQVVSHASGAAKRRIAEIFGNTLSDEEKVNLGALIYMPETMLGVMLPVAGEQQQWYQDTLLRLIRVLRPVSSEYPRAKVRRLIEGRFETLVEELLYEQEQLAIGSCHFLKFECCNLEFI